MDNLLSIRDACEFTGLSESTIKRLIRDIAKDKGHPDRSLILPSHKELERKKKAGEPYRWKLDRELLVKHYPAESENGQGAGKSQAAGSVTADTLTDVLRGQLDSKDQQLRTLETQLDRKDEQIVALNERMRESNILMKELQQKVAIAPPAQTTRDADIVDANDEELEKGSGPNEKSGDDGLSVWHRPIHLFRRTR